MVTAQASHTEHLILGLWRDIFQRSDIEVGDDFFELGGYSLLAAYLVERIDMAFGIKLPPTQLFKTPTVAQMAAFIDQESPVETNNLFAMPSVAPLRLGGSCPPLFCMHSYGGSVFSYRPLSLRLQPDQPVYGIEARGLRDDEELLDSIPAMAAHCVESIRRVRPHGPYYLAGHSFAGTLAFEVAQQLRAAGEEVALLAIFDTWLHYDPSKPVFVTRLKWVVLLNRYRVVSKLRRVLRGARGAERKPVPANAALPHIAMGDEVAEQLAAEIPARYEEIRRVCSAASLAYRPARYGGHVDYFHAKNNPPSMLFDQLKAWTYLAPHITIHPIEAGHVSLLNEPTVEHTAAILAERLPRTSSSEKPPFTAAA